jgi:4-amino-4-deoxy-L-arabinose transferase-like glycosyltransferase
MPNPPNSTRLGRPSRGELVALGVVLLFVIWYRGHTMGPDLTRALGVPLWPTVQGESEPLDCDESVYLFLGRRQVAGDVLYRDWADTKPPLGYWIYALAVGIGGATEWTARLVVLPFVLTTTALVWWVARRMGGARAGLLAAASYAVVGTDPYLFGNGSNLEHFVSGFAVAALALIIGANLDERSGRSLFLLSVCAGMAVGAAVLVKQVAVVSALVILGMAWDRHGLRRRLLAVSGVAAGAAVVVGAALVYLASRGALSAAFEDFVVYGAALAKDVPEDPNAPPRWLRWLTGNADPQGHLPWPFGQTTYLVWWGTGSWPFQLLGAVSVLWLLFGGSGRLGRWLGLWCVSDWIQVAAPGLAWQHYYLLPVPGLAIASALAVCELGRPTPRRRAIRRVAWLVAISALVATAFLQARAYLAMPAERLTVAYKGGGQWVALRALGRQLGPCVREALGPSSERPRLFVWGWQSPLFVYADLDGVSRYFFADPLMKAYSADGREHPLVGPRRDQIMTDLQANPPVLVFAGDPPFPALRTFLDAGYLPSASAGPIIPDGRGLWIRRDVYGAIEGCLTRASDAGRRGTDPPEARR